MDFSFKIYVHIANRIFISCPDSYHIPARSSTFWIWSQLTNFSILWLHIVVWILVLALETRIFTIYSSRISNILRNIKVFSPFPICGLWVSQLVSDWFLTGYIFSNFASYNWSPGLSFVVFIISINFTDAFAGVAPAYFLNFNILFFCVHHSVHLFGLFHPSTSALSEHCLYIRDKFMRSSVFMIPISCSGGAHICILQWNTILWRSKWCRNVI